MVKKIPVNKNINISDIGNIFKVDTTNIEKLDIIGEIIFTKENIPIDVPNPNPKSITFKHSYKIYTNKIIEIDIKKWINFTPDFVRFEIEENDIDFLYLEIN